MSNGVDLGFGILAMMEILMLKIRENKLNKLCCRIMKGRLLGTNSFIENQHIFWHLSLDILSIRNNLAYRGINIFNIFCPLCNLHLKPMLHVFTDCQIALKTLTNLAPWLHMDIP